VEEGEEREEEEAEEEEDVEGRRMRLCTCPMIITNSEV